MAKYGQKKIETQQSFTVTGLKHRQETLEAPKMFTFKATRSFVREVPLVLGK